MARYFTISEAELLVPQIERLLRDAIRYKSEYHDADRELDQLQARVRFSGGARIDRTSFLALRSRRDTSGAALKEKLQQIEESGALVKDLEIGLIDFLTLYQGREVCLCWKLGEASIQFWHGTDEGFRGRKPIDGEFLSNHSTS